MDFYVQFCFGIVHLGVMKNHFSIKSKNVDMSVHALGFYVENTTNMD